MHVGILQILLLTAGSATFFRYEHVIRAHTQQMIYCKISVNIHIRLIDLLFASHHRSDNVSESEFESVLQTAATIISVNFTNRG